MNIMKIKKRLLFLLSIFSLYVATLYFYLYHWADNAIPTHLRGTEVDPATFMTSSELILSQDFSKLRNLLYFINIGWEWLIYIVIIWFGVSKLLEGVTKNTIRFSFIQLSLYMLLLSLLQFVLTLPLSYFGYKQSVSYGITIQNAHGWMREQVIDFWIGYVLLFIIGHTIFFLLKRYEHGWWWRAWILSVPFTLFLTFIQPVVIDPLYNDFTPLKNKELETKILQLASEANIPANRVYEVNMSDKTNALNAYVTGIGSQSRIVLWDTTLEKLSEDEVLFVMAHEMAHYVKKHIYIGIAVYTLLSFIGLYLAERAIRLWIRSQKETTTKHYSSFTVFPVLFFALSILSFASNPLTNLQSRIHEKQSDLYALHLTGDKEAAIETFQVLSKESLSEVNPPSLVKWIRYSHPTILERIQYLEKHK